LESSQNAIQNSQSSETEDFSLLDSIPFSPSSSSNHFIFPDPCPASSFAQSEEYAPRSLGEAQDLEDRNVDEDEDEEHIERAAISKLDDVNTAVPRSELEPSFRLFITLAYQEAVTLYAPTPPYLGGFLGCCAVSAVIDIVHGCVDLGLSRRCSVFPLDFQYIFGSGS
jgi:hypothetical protein